jgi:hypothetical protein
VLLTSARQGTSRQGNPSPDVLKQASEPVSTYDVVTAMLRAGGHGESARRAMAPRVRGNLAYLHNGRKVTKHENDGVVRWSLP